MIKISKVSSIVIITLLSYQLNAYEFSFFNKTSLPIAIAIQFANSEQEPLYKLLIKPNTMKSFVPGTIDIPDIKWSFCLKQIYYAKNPTMQERAHHFAKTIWKKVPITWTNELLATAPKPKRKLQPQSKKQTIGDKYIIITQKPKIKIDDKSLCRDRHFEITENEYGAIIVTGSLREPI